MNTKKGFSTLIIIVIVVVFLIYAGVDVNRVVAIGKNILVSLYDLLMTLIVQPIQKLIG